MGRIARPGVAHGRREYCPSGRRYREREGVASAGGSVPARKGRTIPEEKSPDEFFCGMSTPKQYPNT